MFGLICLSILESLWDAVCKEVAAKEKEDGALDFESIDWSETGRVLNTSGSACHRFTANEGHQFFAESSCQLCMYS